MMVEVNLFEFYYYGATLIERSDLSNLDVSYIATDEFYNIYECNSTGDFYAISLDDER